MNRFKIFNCLGKGSFGEVYSAQDVLTKTEIALKIERLKPKMRPQLQNESEVYYAMQGNVGFPKIYYFNSTTECSILGIQLLKTTIAEKLKQEGGRFSLGYVLDFAIQAINILRALHEKGFIHRDVKPDNFMLDENDKLYAIDFGLTSRYIDPITGSHIPMRINKSLTGTARYASLNAHSGAEASRRDDIESLAYILIYLLKGSLPWQPAEGTEVELSHQDIYRIKMSTTVEQLAFGLPYEFGAFLSFARSLTFEAVPKYSEYSVMFQKLLDRTSNTSVTFGNFSTFITKNISKPDIISLHDIQKNQSTPGHISMAQSTLEFYQPTATLHDATTSSRLKKHVPTSMLSRYKKKAKPMIIVPSLDH